MPDSTGPEKKAADLIAAIRKGASDHLGYDLLEGYVSKRLAQDERELVLAHTELCPRCAAELTDLEAFALTLEQTEEPLTESEEKPAFWPGFWAWARQPRNAIAFTAIFAAAIVLPTLTRFIQKPETIAGRVNDSVLVGALSSGKPIDSHLGKLPAPWRTRILTQLEGGPASRPVSLSFLPPRRGTGLLFPVQEAVADTRPILRFEQRSSPLRIRLFDSSNAMVAESPQLAGTEWKIPFALQRGAIYRWELNRAATASFRVLTSDEFAEWQRLSALYPDVALVRGALALEFGLLDMAGQAFAALPPSDTTRRLLAVTQSR